LAFIVIIMKQNIIDTFMDRKHSILSFFVIIQEKRRASATLHASAATELVFHAIVQQSHYLGVGNDHGRHLQTAA
jgi:hypothetical protein